MTYAELQDDLADLLARTDLVDAIPRFIWRAEAAFRRDPRVYTLRTTTRVVTGGSAPLPEGFKTLQSLYHAGPTYRGEIRTVAPGELSAWGHGGGPIRAAAVVGDELLVAPAVAGTSGQEITLTYHASPIPLSATNPDNWLLLEHPDIYLYGAAIESAPYLRDDERLVVWRSEYERRLEELHFANSQKEFGGTLVTRLAKAIG